MCGQQFYNKQDPNSKTRSIPSIRPFSLNKKTYMHVIKRNDCKYVWNSCVSILLYFNPFQFYHHYTFYFLNGEGDLSLCTLLNQFFLPLYFLKFFSFWFLLVCLHFIYIFFLTLPHFSSSTFSFQAHNTFCLEQLKVTRLKQHLPRGLGICQLQDAVENSFSNTLVTPVP